MSDFIHPDDVSGGPEIKTFGDYLRFMQLQVRTIKWIFSEFTTPFTRKMSVQLLCCQFATAAVGTASVMVTGLLLAAYSRGDWPAIYENLMVIGCLVGVAVMASVQSGHLKEWVLGGNFVRLDKRINELMYEKSLGQHEKYGSVLNHATIDKGKYQTQALQEVIVFQMLYSLVLIVCIIIGLWFLNPIVGAAGTILAVISFTWSTYLNFMVGKFCDSIEREFRRINRTRVEFWEKIARVLTNGLGNRVTEKLDRDMEANMARDRAFWLKFIDLSEIRNFLMSFYLKIILFLLAAWLAEGGKNDVGYLFTILMWSGEFIGHLMQFSYGERQVGRTIIPVQLMKEALSIKPAFDMSMGTPLLRNGPLSLEFRNVTFKYEDPKEGNKVFEVLKNINLLIKPGEKVALLGESGAGKTTLMKLALRYYDPSDGQVLVGGKPLTDLLLSSYMEQIGYIPQHPQILDTTIGDNILFGCTDEKREELSANNYEKLWALMRALMVDFGDRLTRGVSTLVGKHGLMLSGGQMQRVSIAAAIAKDPRLLIIDEATSSLDSVTEEGVQEGLKAALDINVTALIIAHRLSTVRNMCTRFVVLRSVSEIKDGESQIEAIADSFEDLYIVSPTFRRLADAQGLHIKALAA